MNHHQTDSPFPEYLFDLPGELIAQRPPQRRTSSRMLLVDPEKGVLGEKRFSALPDLLVPGDLLVLNDSRVLPARLFTRRKDTGGKVELLLVEPHTDAGTWLAMARPSRRLRAGTCLELLDVLAGSDQPASVVESLLVVENLGDGEVLVRGETDPGDLAQQWGVMPLPPYIHRDFGNSSDREQAEADRSRYQTVYATEEPLGCGSVAAPTAGLHFDGPTLAALRDRGVGMAKVRLHVGPGTFRPPNSAQIKARRLHAERFTFPASLWGQLAATWAAGGRVIAVGTTSLRVLETVARLHLDQVSGSDISFGTQGAEVPLFTGRARRRQEGWEVAGTTRLFLMPPDRVSAVDGLLTNFHLPGSSLLMLVASFLKAGLWPEVYALAIDKGFRFYSYGDCMLALKTERT